MALRSVVGQKILNEVIRGCGGKSNQKPGKISWKIIVVDHYAMRILSSCCKMLELAMEGVLLIEDLFRARQPFPLRDVIYLMSPSEKSVNAVIADFTDDNRGPMYGDIHVFFTEVCPDDLFEKLGKSKCSLRIQTIKEIDMAFLPYESQAFTLDSPQIFKSYYGEPEVNQNEDAQFVRMAEQIATLCATLGEYPYVRYSIYGNTGKNSKLANMVDERLKVYKENAGHTGQSRTQLLILDRSFDCVSPLLHELTFQAMAYDLNDIVGDLYKFTHNGKEKEVFLGEDDEVWVKLRHKPIGVASEHLSEAMKSFSEKKKSLMPKDTTNTKDLAKLIKALLQYQAELKKFATTTSLAQDCMQDNERVRLLCKVEQCLAMKTDDSDEPIKDFMSLLNPVLMDSFVGVSALEKVRVILLYLMSQNGVSQEKLGKLIQHGNIEAEYEPMIMNLAKLGISVIGDSKTQNKTQVPRKYKRQENFNIFARWTPTVKDLMEEIIDDKLDKSNYPFLPGRAPTTGTGVKSHIVSARYGNWHKTGPGNTDANTTRNVPKLIVFIAGGMTLSEMRSAYEISEEKNWEVIIGSSHVITPNGFLRDLKDLTPGVATTATSA